MSARLHHRRVGREFERAETCSRSHAGVRAVRNKKRLSILMLGGSIGGSRKQTQEDQDSQTKDCAVPQAAACVVFVPVDVIKERLQAGLLISFVCAVARVGRCRSPAAASAFEILAHLSCRDVSARPTCKLGRGAKKGARSCDLLPVHRSFRKPRLHTAELRRDRHAARPLEHTAKSGVSGERSLDALRVISRTEGLFGLYKAQRQRATYIICPPRS